jgi:hypothetical protein
MIKLIYYLIIKKMKTKKYVYVFATVAAIAGAGYISGSLLI